MLSSLSGTNSGLGHNSFSSLSHTLSAPSPPTQGNHGDRADNVLRMLELKAFGSQESTAISLRWHRARSCQGPLAPTTAGPAHCLPPPAKCVSLRQSSLLSPPVAHVFVPEWPSENSPGSSSVLVLLDSIFLIMNPPNSSSNALCFHLNLCWNPGTQQICLLYLKIHSLFPIKDSCGFYSGEPGRAGAAEART